MLDDNLEGYGFKGVRDSSGYDHPRFILDYDEVNETALIVNASTYLPEYARVTDQTYLLDQNDHSLLQHTSYLRFRDAEIWPKQRFLRMHKDKIILVKEKLSKDTIADIKEKLRYVDSNRYEICLNHLEESFKSKKLLEKENA